MFHVPEFYPDISLKLASVLEEIGASKRMILKRRRTWLLQETLDKISYTLCDTNTSPHYFGSQSEGTTTQGLQSDSDILLSSVKFSVLQDWGEWEPGFHNLLMIQEETTPPGYCMLQRLYDDEPTALTEVHDEHHVKYRGDNGDKVLLKNTYMNQFHRDGETINGPAGTRHREGFLIQDYVMAFPFKTLPEFLSIWLQQQIEKGNISQDMKRYIESNPCYVVPAGRKDSSFERTEWRISTSHAERCLMLSLNITQLQCYIMLKLLLKTYLRHQQEKALSSFMCKNILLLCKCSSRWGPPNLLSVFTFILLKLKQSISQERCPHFIIHENNLMAHKFAPRIKSWLLERIQVIYETHGRAFLGIEIDDIGNRLQTLLNSPWNCVVVRDISNNQTGHISGNQLHGLANSVSWQHILLLKSIITGKTSFNIVITTLEQLSHQGSNLEQAASRLLTPLVCSSLGSVIASTDIHQDHSVSPEALTWLSLGLNSDVASSRLKLASVYYCVCDFNTTETILRSVEQKYDPSLILAVCNCYDQVGRSSLARFNDYANTHDEPAIRNIVAMCVRFIPEEIHCQPKELQCEMYRSTQKDRAHRDERFDWWMDLALVDSLPYLFFLQYKTYGHLQRFDKQQEALNNLAISIYIIQLSHKETALNLLGQCYQQENRYTEALHCFMDSLNVRPTNNAAKLHICKLLYAIYRNRPRSDTQACNRKRVSNSLQFFAYMTVYSKFKCASL